MKSNLIGFQFKFVRERVAEGEFFLQIDSNNDAQPGKSWRINCIDIEAIEPTQGTKFELRYMKAQSYFSNQKTLKVEVYNSKYLAEIMDSFEVITKMIEESQQRLDQFVVAKGTAKPAQGLLKQRL